jgi:hypothetical protein
MDKNQPEKQGNSMLKKIQTKFRHGLVLQAITYQFSRIGIEFTPYYLFLDSMPEVEITVINIPNEEYSFESLGPDDMKIIGAINYAGYSEDKLLVLLEEGEMCFGLKYKGEIACFMWICFSEFSYKSTEMLLKSDEAYLWFMYTRESFRGKNLAPYLRYRCFNILREMGRVKLYSISDCFNTPAVNFKKKLNAKKVKLVLFIELLKKYNWSITLKNYNPK